jgi:hypothetical protein
MTMHPRVAEEWQDILSLYPDAQSLETPERVELSVDLVPGLYNQARTRLAVIVPPGYRATGPDGFLVPLGLQMGSSPLPTSDGAPLGMSGWLLVSFHLIDAAGQSTWRATSDPRRGDNFVGYVSSIESFLARGCN